MDAFSGTATYFNSPISMACHKLTRQPESCNCQPATIAAANIPCPTLAKLCIYRHIGLTHNNNRKHTQTRKHTHNTLSVKASMPDWFHPNAWHKCSCDFMPQIIHGAANHQHSHKDRMWFVPSLADHKFYRSSPDQVVVVRCMWQTAAVHVHGRWHFHFGCARSAAYRWTMAGKQCFD